MTSSTEPTRQHQAEVGRDEAEALIDQDAAAIDARSPDAPDQIAELVEDADELGLPTPMPSEIEPPALDDV